MPYTILRAASSYLHGPVLQDDQGVWGAAAWPALDEELGKPGGCGGERVVWWSELVDLGILMSIA